MPNIPTLPDSVDNALKNVSDQPTLVIGQTIADIWQLVLGGRIAFAAEKQRLKYAQDLEEYRKTLEQKVTSIPEGKQVEPSIQIAAQALDDSQYCIGSERLREMFANLIARSMHADYSDKVHPSFSKIAQQLSPLDAQMLCILRYAHGGNGIAVVNYIRRDSPDVGYSLLKEGVPAEMPENCSPDFAARSLVALSRLGLVDIPADVHFTAEERYSVFKETPLYKEYDANAKCLGFKLEMQQRLARLTVLGKDFVSVCLD